MTVYRIYIEKREPHDVEAEGICKDIKDSLGIKGLKKVRLLNRYDTQNISQEDFSSAIMTVFGEPQVDIAHDELPQTEGKIIAVEPLPGQYDQRADSAAQCIELCNQRGRPIVKTAKVYIFEGSISNDELSAILDYIINPVEARQASLEMPDTLEDNFPTPPDVMILEGFIKADIAELENTIRDYSLAMDLEDIKFCQQYFIKEDRDPTITEIRLIDTYWSDHCRHTTFSTHLENVVIKDEYINNSYNRYLQLRGTLNRSDRPITLMDLATIGAKALSVNGLLEDLDKSEEINACSVKIKVDNDGVMEDWLLMFKNETHNHPTEIEPFGGAATCLGGAIRDPLSGRAYVYQAMRVTGAGDPTASIEETLKGKLPQKKIVTQAAAGYSSYGNQIGLSTGLVHEIYHKGYTAKRMEVGAVMGAVKAENVVRETPETGDIIMLLGGKTGRDGCGGATGSSKAHTTESLETCGSQVQKGNAPEERKIQRLFRNPLVTKMIKRCNDFGAGGVSVAVGELADSLDIELDAVPKKYEGLDATELAISESQERMAVVIKASDKERFIALSDEENLSATHIATVTDTGRMVMTWRGVKVANLSRDFLDSNGAIKTVSVEIEPPTTAKAKEYKGSFKEKIIALAGGKNVCSQKGLMQRFDCSVGASTVLSPFGGTYQETPIQAMVAKIPVMGETTTASIMAYGFMPTVSEADPYEGAVSAVVSSVAKAVAAGGTRGKCWLSFQEYFERLDKNPTKWGKPLSALLGALDAQLALECGAIGGKDSMSGTFNELAVPPTLISFAVSVTEAKNAVSPEFKKIGNKICAIIPTFENGHMCKKSAAAAIDTLEREMKSGNVVSAWVCGEGGIGEGLIKMCFGNKLGVDLQSEEDIFTSAPATIIVECKEGISGTVKLGHVIEDYQIVCKDEKVSLDEVFAAYTKTLEKVYPYQLPTPKIIVPTYNFTQEGKRVAPIIKIAKPRVLISSFPGTNSEYDTARAFQREGGISDIFVIKNRTPQLIEESVEQFARKIHESQIIAIPGGFSGGDEPEGSGKFIVAFFRNPRIQEAVRDLLFNRDGLMIGICNGFQALIKLGLVPYGDFVTPKDDSPTLTFNRIGRHQSYLCHTRIASNMSPWMMYHNVGDLHTVPISHGEGRFVATEEEIARLAANGQIVAQYVDTNGTPTLDTTFNPNFSQNAIESICSPDGRVIAKMGHSERCGDDVFKNISGDKYQKIFKGAVDYFAK